MEMDFNALNQALNTSAECATLNCTNRVAGDGCCMSCFMGHIEGTVTWDHERKGYVKTVVALQRERKEDG